MAELIVLSATQVGAGDQAYVSFHLPVAATLVGVTVAGVNVVGAPTTGFVSVNEPVLDEVCTVHIKWANAWTGDWRSRHLGGTETPVPLTSRSIYPAASTQRSISRRHCGWRCRVRR